MEKLTLEHLAPYLPYELNTQYQLNDVRSTYPKELRNKVLLPDSCTFILLYCKPILRPLSDLTEEQFKEFFKFNNKTEIIKVKDIKNYRCNYEFRYKPANKKLALEDGWSYSEYVINLKDRLMLHELKVLFSSHIDVFGLIEKGLAIDINSLTSDL